MNQISQLLLKIFIH